MLPAVTIRAVMNRDAVAVVEAGNVGQVIAHAAGDERHASLHLPPVVQRGLEGVSEVDELGDRRLARFDAVRPQLFTSKAKQVKWGYAVAREKAVQRRRPRVTRLPRVTQKQPAPAAGEDQRCAEPGRTTPDNDDVEHERLNCKSRAAEKPSLTKSK